MRRSIINWCLSLFILLATVAHADIKDGLIGHWSFDEGSGSIAKDTCKVDNPSCTEHNGTLVKGPAWVAGKVGVGALQFDGVDDSISLPSINLPSNAVSLTAWINTNASWQRIFAQGSMGTNFSIQLLEGALRVIVGGNGTEQVITNITAFPVNQWAHIAVVFGSSAVKVYINGNQVYTKQVNSTLGTGAYPASIGASGGNWFAGSMDEVRLYNREISADDVSVLYKSTRMPPETIPPSVPTGLAASELKATQVKLSWNASTDNSGVGGYKIYRNGMELGNSMTTYFMDNGLNPATPYTYTVSSYDIAWPSNESAQSSVLPVTTGVMTNILIPDDRKIDWKDNAGVPGGIPHDYIIFTDFSDPAVQAKYNVHPNDGLDDAIGITQAIKDASQAATLGKRVRLLLGDKIRVVYLPEGSYDLFKTLNFNYASGVVLRGAGSGKTILLAEQPGGGGSIMTAGNPAGADSPILNGYTKGSSLISTNDTSKLSPGMILDIDQDNDPDLMWSPYGHKNLLHQYVMITNVDHAAKTIAFEPPLAWPPANWNSSVPANPRFNSFLYNSVKFSGIENMTIKGNPDSPNYLVWLISTYAFWIKNVEFSQASNTSIVLSSAFRTEIRDSYIHDTYSVSDGYGITAFEGGSGLLIENNIIKSQRVSMIFEGTTGAVVDYNYSTDARFVGWPDKQVEDFNANHGPHGIMTLWEGNVGAAFINDGYHGSTSHQTLFRNNFHAKHVDPNRTGNRKAIDLTRYSYYHNVLGNVLGHSGWPAPAVKGYYELEGMSYYIPAIYRLGYPNLGNNGYVLGNPPDGIPGVADSAGLDPKVKETLLRHGNLDYQTNSTVWDPNISNQTLPASLYYTNKPSWWPTSVAWPPIGPDVTGLANKIPAEICYEQGKMPNCNEPTVNLTVGSGDVSNDGKVTMYDAALVLRFTLGSSLTDTQKTAADKNGDGKIDGADVVAIARKALGL